MNWLKGENLGRHMPMAYVQCRVATDRDIKVEIINLGLTTDWSINLPPSTVHKALERWPF